MLFGPMHTFGTCVYIRVPEEQVNEPTILVQEKLGLRRDLLSCLPFDLNETIVLRIASSRITGIC